MQRHLRPRITAGFVLGVLLAVACAGTPRSACAQVPGIDLDRAAALFALLRARSDADGGALWGATVDGPMLIVDPRTREAVANVADPRGHLTATPNGIFRGVLPPDIPIANTAVEWAGQEWGMVQWPVPPDAVMAGMLLVHESFHRIQDDLGFDRAMPVNDHLDTRAGRTWMRLEMRALAAALRADAPLESDAVRDALLFRAWRHRQFRRARSTERQLDLNEGTAEYTGVRLGGATPSQQRAIVLRSLAMYDGQVQLVRTFSYALGPAYGLLLDDADPEWRTALRGSGDLGRLLARALSWRAPRELEARAVERAAQYDFDALDAEEGARDDAHTAHRDELAERFQKGPVLVIPLDSGRYSWTFDSSNIVTLDAKNVIYGGATLTGTFGYLDAPGGMLVSGTGKKRRAIVPAPFDEADGRRLIGGAWSITVADGWMVRPRGRNWELVRR